MVRRFFLLALLFLASVSTSTAQELPGNTLKINISTPENAVKTYWAYLEWQEDQAALAWNQPWVRDEQHYRTRLLAGERLEAEEQRDAERQRRIFKREILSVKQLSDTEAEVVSKVFNTLPIAIPVSNPEDKRNRQEIREEKLWILQKQNGGEFKYILTKDQAGWKINQILMRTPIAYGPDTWSPYYTLRTMPFSGVSLAP